MDPFAITATASAGTAFTLRATHLALCARKRRRELRTQALVDMTRIDAKHQSIEPECAYCDAPVLSGWGWHEECEPRTMVDLGPTTPWIPEPEFVDTSWMDIVGIPFELWCSYGTCHGPNGYAFAPARLNSLTRRRDAGDFIESVDLVKRSRRIPERRVLKQREQTYRYEAYRQRKQRTPLDSGVIAGEELRQAILRNDREVKAALSVPPPGVSPEDVKKALQPQAERNTNVVTPTAEQLRVLLRDSVRGAQWVADHSSHGITWKLALYAAPRLDMLVGACRRCGLALWINFYNQSVEFRSAPLSYHHNPCIEKK